MRRCFASLTIGMLVSAVGCQQVPAIQGLLEKSMPDAHLSSAKLRVLMTDYVGHFADRVEEAADRILAETSDPQIRTHALQWKSNAIAACFRAASRPDPLAAYLDVWILDRQMLEFFEGPAGSDLFGPWQALAVETSRQLEQPLIEFERLLSTRTSIGEGFVETFARDFPIDSLYFARHSLAARYIESVDEPTRELMDVVARLNDSLTEMEKLSALYGEFLPKLARWQAELAVLESREIASLSRSVADLSLAGPAAERLVRTAEQLPNLAGQAQIVLQAFVKQERQATLSEVDRMRSETMQQLREERVAVLDAVRSEREQISDTVAAGADLTLQRMATLVDRQRQAAGQQLVSLLDLASRRLLLGMVIITCALLVVRRSRGWFPRITVPQPSRASPDIVNIPGQVLPLSDNAPGRKAA